MARGRGRQGGGNPNNQNNQGSGTNGAPKKKKGGGQTPEQVQFQKENQKKQEIQKYYVSTFSELTDLFAGSDISRIQYIKPILDEYIEQRDKFVQAVSTSRKKGTIILREFTHAKNDILSFNLDPKEEGVPKVYEAIKKAESLITEAKKYIATRGDYQILYSEFEAVISSYRAVISAYSSINLGINAYSSTSNARIPTLLGNLRTIRDNILQDLCTMTDSLKIIPAQESKKLWEKSGFTSANDIAPLYQLINEANSHLNNPSLIPVQIKEKYGALSSFSGKKLTFSFYLIIFGILVVIGATIYFLLRFTSDSGGSDPYAPTPPGNLKDVSIYMSYIKDEVDSVTTVGGYLYRDGNAIKLSPLPKTIKAEIKTYAFENTTYQSYRKLKIEADGRMLDVVNGEIRPVGPISSNEDGFNFVLPDEQALSFLGDKTPGCLIHRQGSVESIQSPAEFYGWTAFGAPTASKPFGSCSAITTEMCSYAAIVNVLE